MTTDATSTTTQPTPATASANRNVGCDDSCCGSVSMEQLLRELGTYSLEWKLDRVLDDLDGPQADRPSISRAEVARRISGRALRDPAFRDELIRHPRWVYMVALVEAFGVSKMTFLRQVREVRAVEETETVLYFVLPVQREREEAFFEELFGRHFDDADVDSQADAAEGSAETGGPTAERRTVERQVVADAQSSDRSRQALLFRPQATYLATARRLHGGKLPPYLDGVKEIRVVPETPRSLALVVPAPG